MSTELYGLRDDTGEYPEQVAYTPPTVRITATYPANIVGCPEVVTVDLNDAGASTLGMDIRATVLALASVGGTALSLYGR